MKIRLPKFLKKLFGVKEKGKTKGLILTAQPTLPEIDERAPIVSLGPEKPRTEEVSYDATQTVLKSCAVCKFALHDENLGDMNSIICTVNPNDPQMKPSDDTCLKHESKYKDLKVIMDKGTLLEYDTDRANTRAQPLVGQETTFREAGVEEVGEEQWAL